VVKEETGSICDSYTNCHDFVPFGVKSVGVMNNAFWALPMTDAGYQINE
jgi:hypothetical protein